MRGAVFWSSKRITDEHTVISHSNLNLISLWSYICCMTLVFYTDYLLLHHKVCPVGEIRTESKNIKSEKPSTNNHCGINLFHLERKLVQTKSQIMIYMPHSYVASTAYNLYHMTVLYSFKQNISNICKTVVFPSSFLCMFFWGWLSLPFFLRGCFRLFFSGTHQ